MRILKLLGILMLIGMFASVLLGGRENENQTSQPVVSTPVVMDEDAKRQAENDRKIAEAQRQYDDARIAEKPLGVELPTQSKAMDFDSCKKLQSSIALSAIGTPTKVISTINTDILTSIRVCTVDGSVLISCSGPDSKMVATQSQNRDGCA